MKLEQKPDQGAFLLFGRHAVGAEMLQAVRGFELRKALGRMGCQAGL